MFTKECLLILNTNREGKQSAMYCILYALDVLNHCSYDGYLLTRYSGT